MRGVLLESIPKAGVRATFARLSIVAFVQVVQVVKESGFAVLDLPWLQLAQELLRVQ